MQHQQTDILLDQGARIVPRVAAAAIREESIAILDMLDRHGRHVNSPAPGPEVGLQRIRSKPLSEHHLLATEIARAIKCPNIITDHYKILGLC